VTKLVAVVALVAASLGLVVQPAAAGAANVPRPNPALTPGVADPAVTQENIGQTICVPGYAKRVRNVSAETKQSVFVAYGIKKGKRDDYEIDHLIALELGGSNDIKNLWPQPEGKKTGATRKDKVETKLRKLVCTGGLLLADAQRAIATDWYAARETTATTTTTTTAPPPPPTTVAPPTTAAPQPAPAGATAICNDGTYSESQHRRGTCSSHGGVREFLQDIPP
jgi:hypothetical protein